MAKQEALFRTQKEEATKTRVWRCVSKVISGRWCEENCVVWARFRPRCCVLLLGWQIWEPVSEEGEEDADQSS